MNKTSRNPLAGLIEAFDAERARIEADQMTRFTDEELASGQPVWLRRCGHSGCVITADHKHGVI